MPGNGWILEKGATGITPTKSYNIRHRDFKIIYANNGLYFHLKVDGQKNYVGVTGNGTFGDIELTTTSKLFDSSEYMQVIHTVKNVGQNKHIVGLGFEVDIDFSIGSSRGDHCGHRNIEPFKGVYNFHLGRNATFLLRSTAFVTNVDTYAYIGMPNFGVWTNNTKYSKVPDGKGDKIYFSWQNREIPPNEEKIFSYVVGIGDYKEYELNLSTKIEECYLPSSHLKLDFSLNSVELDQTVTIERDFEGNKISNTLTDSGSPHFSDKFDLPSSVGEHFVKYKIVNEKYGEREFVYRILVDVPPEVSVLNWKNEFSSGENFSISLKVKCDTKCKVSIINDNS